MYYNTTHETGEQLELYNLKATAQEDRILAFMQRHRNQDWTRDELHERVCPEAPPNSIGRALSTLAKFGVIEKTETMRTGRFGRRQHAYMIRG